MYGERMRKIRELHKLSQTDIARLLNVTSMTISRYEAEQRTPDPKIFAWYCRYFNVSADWLLGLTDDQAPIIPSQASNEALAEYKKTAPIYKVTDEQLAAALPPEIRESMMALIRIEVEKRIDEKKN